MVPTNRVEVVSETSPPSSPLTKSQRSRDSRRQEESFAEGLVEIRGDSTSDDGRQGKTKTVFIGFSFRQRSVHSPDCGESFRTGVGEDMGSPSSLWSTSTSSLGVMGPGSPLPQKYSPC